MCRTQCVLALLALYVGLAHSFSWDVVLANSKQLEFYDTNGTLTHTEVSLTKSNIRSIVYDPVDNRVLFTEQNGSYDSLASFDIATRKTQSLNTSFEYSQIAYDPATQILFWMNDQRTTINSILTKPGYNNTVNRNLLNFDLRETPNDFAVDSSCGGHIYWTTNSTIMRARLDGSEREVVIDSSVSSRESIAIDQQTQKMYWLDSQYGDQIESKIKMSVESADLNGKNRRTLYNLRVNSISGRPLTVSKDYIYWIITDTYFPTLALWQLSKNPSRDRDAEPKQISNSLFLFFVSHLQTLASNYGIKEETQGIENCEALKIDSQPINSATSNYDSLIESTADVSMLCVHGTKVNGRSRCECAQGYIGERCDVSVCHNYCFQGDCSVSAEGQPKCRCNAGYSGERCEDNACHEYSLLLNTGKKRLESEVPVKDTDSENFKNLATVKTELVDLQTELMRTQLNDGKEKLEHNRMLRAMEMEDVKRKYEHNENIRKLELARYNVNK